MRRSKRGSEEKEYKHFFEPRTLRILVEVLNIRSSQRYKLHHGAPPPEDAKFYIRGEVFTQRLVPQGYDMVVELYKDEIRRWIVHHYPDLSKDQEQLIVLERFVWSFTHEIWHVIELDGNLQITFVGDWEL